MTLTATRQTAPVPLHPTERRRWVRGQSAELAVYEYGPEPGPGVPEVLLVHGYPDDHTVFAGVIPLLAADHHVITYDTRDAGLSTVQESVPANFRLALLVEDLYAVLEAAAGGPHGIRGHSPGSPGTSAFQDRTCSISGPGSHSGCGHPAAGSMSSSRVCGVPTSLCFKSRCCPKRSFPSSVRGSMSGPRAGQPAGIRSADSPCTGPTLHPRASPQHRARSGYQWTSLCRFEIRSCPRP